MSRYALHVMHKLIVFNTHYIMHCLVFLITKLWCSFHILPLSLQFPKCTSSSCYLKVLLDVFHIQYANIKATLLAWRAKTLLKTAVLGDLVPHQMFQFYHEFFITDTTTWSDLSYERAESILRAMKEEKSRRRWIHWPLIPQIQILHQSPMMHRF